jgi:iron complex outermembrane recepter protein
MTMKPGACALILAGIMAVWSASAGEPAVQTFRLNIAAQPIDDALHDFARQAGLQVFLATEDGKGVMTSQVIGTFTAQDALERLLANTGLHYEYIDARTVAIRSGPRISNASERSAEEIRLAQAESASSSAASTASGQSPDEQRNRAASIENAPAGKLEEVVVTAQKRVERLQDVPAPVTAIDTESLASHNLLRLQDYYTKIPGLGLTLAGNGSAPIVIIRGISTGAGNNPTTGTVVDEVPYGSSVSIAATDFPIADIDPSDLARIEVLRGPQGTLYGASNMGGLVKFVTTDPSLERFAGRVQVGGTSVSHGDDFGYSVRGNINVPLTDTFAIRASGFKVRDPGFIDNPETGEKDANIRDSDGGRLSALWRPSERFSVKLSALFQDSERVATEDVDTAFGEDPQQSFLNGTGSYRRETQAYSATLVGKVGRAELTSVTGYSVDGSDSSLDTTLLANGLFGTRAEVLFPGTGRTVTLEVGDVEKFTQETRLSMPIGERFNWLLGAFYTDEDITMSNDTWAASSVGSRAGLMVGTTFDPMTFREYAAFSTLTADLTERWDVQFGGRYSDLRRVTRSVGINRLFNPGAVATTNLFPESEDHAFTYLVTPRFKVSPDSIVYARLASGYRPGGPNSRCGTPDVPCTFGPDETRNYDIGIKGKVLDGALSFDASVYYIDWQDLQLNSIFTPNGVASYTGNVSAAKSQGVELSVESRPLRGTTLSAWVAYNEAELTESFRASGAAGDPGDRLPYSSRFSGNVSLDQGFPLWGTATGFIGGSISYVGERLGRFRGVGTPRTVFPSYVQLDLSAGVKYDSWSLDIFVNNATNKLGVLRGGLDAAFIPSYFTYIQPRTIGMSLARSF